MNAFFGHFLYFSASFPNPATFKTTYFPGRALGAPCPQLLPCLSHLVCIECLFRPDITALHLLVLSSRAIYRTLTLHPCTSIGWVHFSPPFRSLITFIKPLFKLAILLVCLCFWTIFSPYFQGQGQHLAYSIFSGIESTIPHIDSLLRLIFP